MHVFISIFFFLSIGCGLSQTEVTPPPIVETPKEVIVIPTDSVVVFGGPEAGFPGGYKALKLYITENFTIDDLPEEYQENGRVYISFIVCENGELDEIRVARGLNQELDALCIEFVRNMPDWIPAEDRNGPVQTRVRLPFTFSTY